MSVLSAILAFVLFMIAAFHAYWGSGGIWPGADARTCARTVVDARGITTMPSPAAGFAVAGAIVLTGLVALALGGLVSAPISATAVVVIGFLSALVFLARGVAGFTSIWRRHWPEQPFARLDTAFYSPLCLVLGTAFVVPSLKGLV